METWPQSMCSIWTSYRSSTSTPLPDLVASALLFFLAAAFGFLALGVSSTAPVLLRLLDSFVGASGVAEVNGIILDMSAGLLRAYHWHWQEMRC